MKKKVKVLKILSLIMAVVLIMSAFPLNTFAAEAEIIKIGKCGENVTYALDSEGLLTISGDGEMENYLNGSSPFYAKSSIKSVLIKNGVTSIGKYAFSNCSDITSVTIGNSVTSIGESAFLGCTELTSVEIPNSVTSIGYGAFYYCKGLTNVTIGNSVTNIGYLVFEECTGLTSITVGSGNQYFSSDSYGVLFNKDKTELIKYPVGNKRTSYIIPNSVTNICYCAFFYCTDLTSIQIPNGVTSIDDDAFHDCTGLTSIEIPNSVTDIGDRAFEGCTGLKEAYFGKNITSIGSFRDCDNLSILTITSEEFFDEYLFNSYSNNLTFVINEKNTKAINYAKNKGYNVITFNYSEADKCLKFNGNTVIYQRLEYKYLPELINNCPDVDKLYFQRLEFDGVSPDIFEVEFDKLDKESENLVFNNLYVNLTEIRNGEKKKLTFAKILELIETGEYEAFGINVTSDEGTFFEKIFQKIGEFVTSVKEFFTKVINLVASIFKKK